MTRNAKRMLCTALLGVGCAVGWLAHNFATTTLRRSDLWSGGVLFFIVTFLGLFNARKKIPFIPLFRASTWMQAHIYLGLFSVWLFVLHTGARFPRGGLEIAIWSLFVAVTVSGVAGIGLSRWAPGRLTLHGENLIFERIPGLRSQVRAEAEKLAIESTQETNSSTIADFFEARLHRHFMGVRHVVSHWTGSKKPLSRLVGEARSLDRYLSPKEREIMARMTELIEAKDNLDYQYSVQALLKGWLIVHIPLTYSLWIAGAVHGLLAWKLS